MRELIVNRKEKHSKLKFIALNNCRSDLPTRQNETLTGSPGSVTLNLFQGLLPSRFDDNLDKTLTGKPLTRFCKPHTSATKSVSPAGRDDLRRCAFIPAEGGRSLFRHPKPTTRHPERICVRTECNESGLREYRVGRAVRLEDEAIRAWSKSKTLVSESPTVENSNSCEGTLARQTSPVTLNSFQGLLPLNVNDNREINSPTGQTNIDRSRTKFGMTKRCAFTLAEVLITLGIIGIVASMTLPTLIHKYQAKVFETRFKKSVATITEIINRTRYDMGIENIAAYCASDSSQCYPYINNNLIPLVKQKYRNDWQVYYNIDRTSDDIKTYNGKNNFKLSTNEYAIFFTNELKDGTFLGYKVGGGNLTFAIDLNGYGKPNRLGHDIFYFRVSNNTKSQLTFEKPNNNLTDEQATQRWENSENVNKNYYMSKEGNPCNKTSTRAGNGIGCAYYALKNECPDDSTKTYWECLPK